MIYRSIVNTVPTFQVARKLFWNTVISTADTGTTNRAVLLARIVQSRHQSLIDSDNPEQHSRVNMPMFLCFGICGSRPPLSSELEREKKAAGDSYISVITSSSAQAQVRMNRQIELEQRRPI